MFCTRIEPLEELAYMLSNSAQLSLLSEISLKVFHRGTLVNTLLCQAKVEVKDLLQCAKNGTGARSYTL